MTKRPGIARQPRRPDWLSVDEAREIILSRVGELDRELVRLSVALGRVLAADVESTVTHPAWDNSAMDGFAVLSRDVARASRERPVVLRVIDEIPAGAFPTRAVGSGEAVRVMTGAAVPTGADGVTRLEHTEPGPEPGTVKVIDGSDAGRNIRRRGEDLKVGARPLTAGTLLRPAEIGVLAMLGQPSAPVYRKPKVGILATGDELADFDELEEVHAGRRIMNSNSYALAAQVQEAGGEPVMLGIARDDPDSLRTRLESAIGNEVLITSAGLAVGDHDYVKEVLDDLGLEFLFYRVQMRPGSPFTFGMLGAMPVFALPGNPVSAMVTFEVLVRPALRKMTGLLEYDRPWRRVRLAEPVTTTGRRTHFYRVTLERQEATLLARLTGPQGSGILTSMSEADALIRVPADSTLPPGSEVDAIVLRER
ncbi:MAG: molybdopterin molybdenumtransferase MoeA [Gemmatimonadetes bacterium]|nr:molybdopterin molybdenumtransferase MoeA [Gemmatimonadota bacterium]NIO32241.1 molybdopterin molybdenumtransferase MoeA [Gemmatimonadota bacterium]